MFKTITKLVKHISCVQEAMLHVVDELRQRAFVHDASKFEQDELEGVARFEDMPEGLQYGSPEYEAAKAKVLQDNPFFELHKARNDHHPEHFDVPEQGVDLGMMGVFPLIEMVCDWAGAHLAYGNKGDWHESVRINIEKHDFTDAQQWVIHDIADFLYRKLPELRDDVIEGDVIEYANNGDAPPKPVPFPDKFPKSFMKMSFRQISDLASQTPETDRLLHDLVNHLSNQQKQIDRKVAR